MTERFVVIMAGGRGERFWPQSRLHKPKHLLPIVGRDPMLSQTIARVLPLVPAKNILIITTRQQLAEVRKASAGLPRRNLIVEPVGRDTAPAVGLAMLLVRGPAGGPCDPGRGRFQDAVGRGVPGGRVGG